MAALVICIHLHFKVCVIINVIVDHDRWRKPERHIAFLIRPPCSQAADRKNTRRKTQKLTHRLHMIANLANIATTETTGLSRQDKILHG
ncbi:MAG: hypothetical protein CBD27_10200 [Rhodospirillaceae bacterium TMED167]|nr:hypothetical protein [Rhodospirillaceae bacterium]OUW24967.1 MAG: hypothetical protein CBD27_10200 [Rhodospirillaceae bacterium TMED167]